MRQGLVGLCLVVAISEVTCFVPHGSNGHSVKLEQQKSLSKHTKDGEGSLTSNDGPSSRRQAISFIGTIVLGGLATTANAAVTDETDNFGENWWTGDISKSPFVDAATPKTRQSQSTTTDEKLIQIPKDKLKGGLGIELGEVEFRTNVRVYVKSVSPGSVADRLGIQKDWIIVGVDGQSTERTNAEGVAIMVSRAVRGEGDTLEFRFRDTAIFQDKLEDLQGGQVTTQVAPGGDTTQRNQDGSVKAGRSVTEQEDQRLTVAQLVPPKMCTHGAETDDLLEISYIGRVLETGAIFDGSAIRINGEGIAGRGNDVSIYFVLGKQPFGQFPPGWDVGLYGICVGERRRLIIPPAMAYGPKGLPRRGIPPNAALQYDVTLVSVNGLSTP